MRLKPIFVFLFLDGVKIEFLYVVTEKESSQALVKTSLETYSVGRTLYFDTLWQVFVSLLTQAYFIMSSSTGAITIDPSISLAQNRVTFLLLLLCGEFLAALWSCLKKEKKTWFCTCHQKYKYLLILILITFTLAESFSSVIIYVNR